VGKSENKGGSKIAKFFKWVFYIIIGFLVGSVLTVVIYKFIAPPVTPLMLTRVVEGWFEGRSVGIDKDWVDYDEISPNFFKAVVSSEDGRFMKHGGVDWRAVDAAKKYNERNAGKKMRGASTITMQTAKNAFLWNGRNYVRKAFELYFTYLIEAVWGKQRIIEVYANIIEMGDGIYGVEAASQRFFGHSAKTLSKKEAALIAAVLPNPRRWSPAAPTNYIQKRVKFISGRINSASIPRAKK
jgi:monofunctional biosynthetic peptidoglycan transglycosylase